MMTEPTTTETVTYPTLQKWMEGTGTHTAELARRAGCKVQHMSNVLCKSRRCSYALGWKLHEITGVPFSAIVQWPPKYRPRRRVA